MQPDTHALAAGPLRRILDGAIAQGIEDYVKVLQQSGHSLPCGLHAKMLEQAGCAGATLFRARALCAGGDFRIRTIVSDAAPELVLAEYLELFESGVINAPMIKSYLRLASAVGRHEESRPLTSPTLVAKSCLLDEAHGFGHGWLSSIKRAVLDATDRTEWQEEAHSVRRQHYVHQTETIEDAALQLLLDRFREETRRYIDDLPPPAHSISRWIPKSFTIRPWAVVSHGDGYNIPHSHSRGWISGVFYAAWEHAAGEDGGVLRVGRPADVSADAPGWPDLTILPVPGTLVLMPSHFTHWTTPMRTAGLRVAVAFDVVDARAGSVPLV